MHLADGMLVLSASDLVGFLECGHLTRQDVAVARRELRPPRLEDPGLEIVRRRGGEHEARLLESFRNAGRSVVEIHTDKATQAAYRDAQERTLAAMREGVDVVYQGVLFDGRWLAYADFLEKVPRRSQLGEHSYEVADTKLARRPKASALIQVSLYSCMLAQLQGVEPESLHLVLGAGRRERFRVPESAPFVRAVRRRLEQVVAAYPWESYPEPVDHCGICRWTEVCRQRWEADDHLTLVAGMRCDQSARLRDAGIRTVADLAGSTNELHVPRISQRALERLRHQARLQVVGRDESRICYELLPPAEDGAGLAALPEPVIGDLFMDLEGDPFVGDEGLEYLFGVVEVTGDGPQFNAFWAHDRASEKRAFEQVVDFIIDRLDREPRLHVYHYAPYEPTALKRLMGRHATRELEIDRLLRGGVLVDLYQVVRQSLMTSQDSYSLKKVESLYTGTREGEIQDAGSSIVAYERWLESRDPILLEEIEHYNREDCLSTLELRQWLDDRRPECEAMFGISLARPCPHEGLSPPEQLQIEEELARLADLLLSEVPDDPAVRSREQHARWLLAQALFWHRREARSQWWAHFRRLEMSKEELLADTEALGGLRHDQVVGRTKRSLVHRYVFEPQEHKILPGTSALDPHTGKPAGTVVEVDGVEGWILLRRGERSEVPHPGALIPPEPLNDTPLRRAIRRLADWVLANGAVGPGRYRAARDLLLCRPRLPAVEGGLTAAEAAVAMVPRLGATCLGIQGPPGTGKTTTGAAMIVSLLGQGRKVGVTALSHKVIGNLLSAVAREASRREVPLRGLQKAEPEEHCGVHGVGLARHNSEVVAALVSGDAQLVAGTAWLYADPDMTALVDTLVIDEAGQVPLANVLAICGAASDLVLLGDPRQLAQPLQGSHPPGAAVSALEHLLAGQETMPADRGLFLDMTWRMHPQLCRFISEVAYAGRLTSAPECVQHRVGGDDPLSGSGVRFRPVNHQANRTSSTEEAGAVAELVAALQGRPWADRNGIRHLTLEDILIVAPYNAHVALLRRQLAPGARVGTVDKFQGQEAPVVIYSMATSSPEEVPHAAEFLFSLNRLNVAISRAQGLAILVCSPELLMLRPRKVEHVRLAGAMYRLVELAGTRDMER